MTEDQKFWVVIWGFVTLVVVALLAFPASYFTSKNELIVKAVLAGASPAQIACALGGDDTAKHALWQRERP